MVKARRIIPGILIVAGVLALAAVATPRMGIGLASTSSSGQASEPQGGLAVSETDGQTEDNSQLKGSAQDAGADEPAPFVGISLRAMTEEELTERGIENGVLIIEVVDGSPAAGVLMPDDVITVINGNAVSSPEDVATIVGGSSPGDVLTFSVVRGSETLDVEVTVGEREADSGDGWSGFYPDHSMFYHHYMLDKLIKAEFKVEADDGTRTYRAAVGTVQAVDVAAGTFDLLLKDGSETISYQVTPETMVIIGHEGSLAGLNTEDRTAVLDVMVNDSGTWETLIVAQGEVLEHHGHGFGGPHHPFMGRHFQGAPEIWQRIEEFLPPGMAEGMEGRLFDMERFLEQLPGDFGDEAESGA
jgi:hypothetical protein